MAYAGLPTKARLQDDLKLLKYDDILSIKKV